MSLVSLKAELRQQLKLSPQLLQSMEILQMNSQELLEYLGRLTEENPLLEPEDAPSLRDAYEELRQKASWIDGGVYGATFAHAENAPPERGAADRELESLAAFLRDQLERMRLPKPLLALSKYIAEMVDEDGYLDDADLDGLRELKIPDTLIRQALDTVQSLDPAGVGARDLSECLLLQLARRENVSPAVMDIAARFLPELGKKHYGPIARELGLSAAEIQAAEKVISSLDPHPGRAFQPAEPAVYVRPDVFIVELDGVLTAVLNEYYLPRISISSYYTRLLKDSDEKETRDYLRQKMQQAKWLLTSLDRRGGTLRRCADAILEAQRPFFAGETGELAPMSLLSLSEALELHPSTISRAARDKYLQCRQGTYPLRYFFSRAVGEQGPSRQAVKQRLLALVQNEDPRRPLSDQRLCELLAEDGVRVARRTVAKYRMELRLPSSSGRRR
ncbi:RNA polymerase factor sigma-54 [Oscillibacter sp. 1-3]|uniref:RNA polymerase factor sigma-54 n=1 Tax=Oscillibacter sp. 1-3 TaxID=1235797 RepID=UPI000334BE30|nr:RNA polymerase factor sigma-54 [Oscillibacter sp. 1-3]EOS65910.1 RNA polymerase sigma-54 factor [Oscillibacter sp. 1-3]MCI9512212.1 RNA polymerase factor sigma-54 [Oscillibacter sp.]